MNLGPIEKGASEGQKTYGDDLVKALKVGVTSRSRAGTVGSKTKKGKRKKGDAGPTSPTRSTENVVTRPQQFDSSWGLFEPIHDILGPVVDIFSPMISSQMVIGFLLFIIIFNYLRSPSSSSSKSLTHLDIPTPQRLAAYEEIWRKEESELWHWLEERVGVQEILCPGGSVDDREALAKAKRQREQSLKAKGMQKALTDVKMSERQVDSAIRITEERLGVLKRAVEEGKEAKVRGEGEKLERERKAAVEGEEKIEVER